MSSNLLSQDYVKVPRRLIEEGIVHLRGYELLVEQNNELKNLIQTLQKSLDLEKREKDIIAREKDLEIRELAFTNTKLQDQIRVQQEEIQAKAKRLDFLETAIQDLTKKPNRKWWCFFLCR